MKCAGVGVENFSKNTHVQCAEQKAVVRRVCGCARIGSTQILWVKVSLQLYSLDLFGVLKDGPKT